MSWLDYYCSCQLPVPVPVQMKKTLNKLWPALAESKLAIALFAGLFVAAVIFLSVPPQFAVRGTIGEPILVELYVPNLPDFLPTVSFSLTVTDLFCVVVEASSLAGLVGRRRRRFAGAGGGDEWSCTATAR